MLRFWTKVDRNGPISRLGSACWSWTAGLDPDGYGRFSLGGKNLRAHVVAFELGGGTIPEGFTIDHLCRNRACVNASHMEAVTRAENVRRGNVDRAAERTHCRRGHEFTAANTVVRGNARVCRACGRDRMKRYRTKGHPVAG